MKILFVCTGNTCRSPMAEAMLKSGSNQFNVQSAGIYASVGSPLSEGTKEVLEDVGINIIHEAQQVTEELIDWADLVLTMTHEHKQILIQEFRSKKEKFFTLKEYNIEYKERALHQYLTALKNLEEKQNLFKEPKEGFKTDLEREVAITTFVREELAEVQELQQKLSEENIQDPFGQNKQVYETTYNELKVELNKLIKSEG